MRAPTLNRLLELFVGARGRFFEFGPILLQLLEVPGLQLLELRFLGVLLLSLKDMQCYSEMK